MQRECNDRCNEAIPAQETKTIHQFHPILKTNSFAPTQLDIFNKQF